MQYRQLGSSGIEVSALALGTMMFGKWGNPDESACRQMVDAALGAGVTLFDTADIYDFGVSEEILGRAVAGRRDRVVLARTKEAGANVPPRSTKVGSFCAFTGRKKSPDASRSRSCARTGV